MTNIEKIRKEIERRKKSLRAGICNDEAFTRKQKNEMLVASEELDRLNRFITTLESEKPVPSDLEEAAEEHINKALFKWSYDDEDGIEQYVYDAFKAEAEWMAQQGVKAHCIESSNPMSENPNQRLHLITLLYEENENTPYVVAGDDVELTLRKR